MWRKTVISLLVFMIIFSLSTVGYAANMNNPKQKVDLSKYQVNTPEGESIASKKNVVLVSGKAPEGTSIEIEVYGAVDLTGKNYTLAKLPNEEDYILISSQTIKSGIAGYGEEIELIMGINKIIITFNVNGVPSHEKIIYYYEAAQLDKALNNTKILPTTK